MASLSRKQEIDLVTLNELSDHLTNEVHFHHFQFFSDPSSGVLVLIAAKFSC